MTWATALISSGGSLTKLGAGVLTLSGVNTYSGPTVIASGGLILESGLPTSSVVMSSNTTLDLSVGTDSLVALGSLVDAAGSPTSHQVLLGDNTLVTGLDSTSTTFSGAISGNGGLIKAGSGTFTLAGSNTYGGGTTIAAGELALAGGAALPPNGSISFTGGALQAIDSTDYSARFSTAPGQAYRSITNGQNVTWATAMNSSGGSLTKLGAGMLTLTNSNTYSGTTTVTQARFNLAMVPGHDVALAGNIVNNASLVCNLNGSETSSGIIRHRQPGEERSRRSDHDRLQHLYRRRRSAPARCNWAMERLATTVRRPATSSITSFWPTTSTAIRHMPAQWR